MLPHQPHDVSPAFISSHRHPKTLFLSHDTPLALY
nr:MAG TPA: hypothetical protein [Bacteriophage sp.]